MSDSYGIIVNGKRYSTMKDATVEESGLMSPTDKSNIDDIPSLETNVTNLSSEVSTASRNVTSLQSSVTTLQSSVSTLESKISSYESSTPSVQCGTVNVTSISSLSYVNGNVTFSSAYPSGTEVYVFLTFAPSTSINGSYTYFGYCTPFLYSVSTTGFTWYVSNASSYSFSGSSGKLYWIAFGF